MAVTLSTPTGYTITFTWRQPGDARGQTTVHLGTNTPGVADMNDNDFRAFVGEMVDNMEAFSDCQVESVSVNATFDVTGNAAYGDSPNVERKAVFIFQTAAGFPARVTVPGLTNAALGSDGINITRSGSTFSGSLATPLQAFHDKLQNGATINLLTYPVVDRRGSDFNGLLDAYQQHRRSARG